MRLVVEARNFKRFVLEYEDSADVIEATIGSSEVTLKLYADDTLKSSAISGSVTGRKSSVHPSATCSVAENPIGELDTDLSRNDFNNDRQMEEEQEESQQPTRRLYVFLPYCERRTIEIDNGKQDFTTFMEKIALLARTEPKQLRIFSPTGHRLKKSNINSILPYLLAVRVERFDACTCIRVCWQSKLIYVTVDRRDTIRTLKSKACSRFRTRELSHIILSKDNLWMINQ